MLGDRLGVEVEPALRVYPRGAAEPCAPPPVDLRLELAAGRTEPLKRGAPRAIVVRLILGGEPARAIVALTDACRRLSSLCLGRVCCIEPSEAILTGNLTAGNPSGCLLPVPTGSRCTGVGAVGGVSTANLPAKITCDPSTQQTHLRRPVPWAREVMVLDDLSVGRFLCGVGAGATGFDAAVLSHDLLSPAASPLSSALPTSSSTFREQTGFRQGARRLWSRSPTR
jgi:hypothetical protein